MIDTYLKTFKKHDLSFARCFGSKSSYRHTHPKDKVYFNCRIYTKEFYEKEKNNKILDFIKGMENEIWYGDLNLTLDKDSLQKIVNELDFTIIITREFGELISEIAPE